MDFIAPGILAMVLLFGSVFSGVTVIMDRQFGFLRETLVAPVNRVSIVLGKALGGATTAVIQGLLMLVIAFLLGTRLNWSSIPLAVVVMALISLAFVSLGIALASLMEDMHGFQLVINFLVFPPFFLSGALFPLSGAPVPIRVASLLNPLTYGVDALRLLFLGTSSFSLAFDLAVLSTFFVATTFAAAELFKRIEN